MNYIFRLSFLAFFGMLMGQSYAQEGYNIRVKIDNYPSDTCILGYRMGKQTYVRDTVTKRNKKGEFVFAGDESLKGGIYIILTKPDNRYLEFLVGNEKDQQDLYIYTKKDPEKGMNEHLKIKGSEDNKVFLEYLDFLGEVRDKNQPLESQLAAAKKEQNKELMAELEAKIQENNDKVMEYQDNVAKKYPDFLCSKLIMASRQPVVPDEIKGDRTQAFYYFREHFWDNFDWSDPRMIRTPLLEEKVEFYVNKLTVQAPDSVVKGSDYVLQLAKKGGNKEIFQYVAAHLLNKYAKTKVICMDAVYVHIGEKYYCSGGADWVDSAQLAKICENVQTLKPLRCGQYAPNITLRNIQTGQPVNLYDVKAEFVALYFWDPSCGNCTKTSAKLVPVYEKYKDKGFEIFGVCSETWKDISKCKNKVEEKKMAWINATDDAYPLAVAKKRYDIKMNPYIVLINKDKKILWKRIDPQQLDNILERELTNKDK